MKEAPHYLECDWDSAGEVPEYEDSPLLETGLALIVIVSITPLVLGALIFMCRRESRTPKDKKIIWACSFLFAALSVSQFTDCRERVQV